MNSKLSYDAQMMVCLGLVFLAPFVCVGISLVLVLVSSHYGG